MGNFGIFQFKMSSFGTDHVLNKLCFSICARFAGALQELSNNFSCIAIIHLFIFFNRYMFCFALVQEHWSNAHDVRDGSFLGRGTGFPDNHLGSKRPVSLNF